MDSLKQTDLWDRTLVVLTSDHGIRQPDDLYVFNPAKYHIPLVFTGGVIREVGEKNTLGSHTDLPYTIQELVLSTRDTSMKFSKSLFSPNSFAYYFYQVGCGLLTDSTQFVYDFPSEGVVHRDGDGMINEDGTKRNLLLYTQSVGDHFNGLK